MLTTTFDQLRRRWADLGLIGVANLLAQILTYLVIVAVVTPFLFGMLTGPAGRRTLLPQGGLTTGMGLRDLFVLAGGAAGIASLLVLGLSMLGTAFMLAGLFGAVGRLRQGESVSFRTYWNAGAAGFGRALGVCAVFVLLALALLVVVGGLLWFLLPFNIVLWGLLAVPAMLYFLFYPVYLTTVQGQNLGQAFRGSIQALTSNPTEAGLAGLTLLLFSAVYSVVLGLLFRLGFIGQILGAVVQLLAIPTLVLYVIERYEQRVAKKATAQ